MENVIPAGKYKVLSQAQLMAVFPVTEFVSVTVGKIRRAGQTKANGQTATADWASVTIETKTGEKVLIDGLQLAKQAIVDDKLRAEVFETFKVSAAGESDAIAITKLEFKPTFRLGKNGKFTC